MYVIVLSGGSGSRLWPLSNNVRSKQFLKVLRNDKGEPESMLQRVGRQLTASGIPQENIAVITAQSQADMIRMQLEDRVDIIAEPERRNTFPAIALSAVYLHDIKAADPDETVIVMPVDVYAERAYFDLFTQMDGIIQEKKAELTLMGIRPAEPSEKYGYIVPETEDKADVTYVSCFAEKPPREKAEQLIAQGALWNGGVFAFRLGWMLGILGQYTDVRGFDELYQQYGTLPKNSFDYEVVEKIRERIAVVQYRGEWTDLGTWNSLTEKMGEPFSGSVTDTGTNENVHIVNELGIPLVALGLRDTVICATPDGILVSEKNASEGLKDYIKEIEHRPMYEHRRWGKYTVLDYKEFDDNTKSLTKHLLIDDGSNISYQRHQRREEIWTVVYGTGEVILDGVTSSVRVGDVIRVKKGTKHLVRGIRDLHIIEVQIGDELTEEDIERF